MATANLKQVGLFFSAVLFKNNLISNFLLKFGDGDGPNLCRVKK